MDEFILRVITYNILSSSFERFHDYCPEEFRSWDYRRDKLAQQLKEWDGDIISLQEFNTIAQRDLTPKFPKGVYKNSTMCKSRKGLGIFYKQDQIKLIKQESIIFSNIWIKFKERFSISKQDSETIDTLIETRDDSALFIHFRHLMSNKTFIFVTTHLYHDPNYPDIKSIQGCLLLFHLETFIRKQNLPNSIPIIITGDFNSLPIKFLTDEFDVVPSSDGLVSGTYQLFSSGNLPVEHPHHPNSREYFRWKRETGRKNKQKPKHNFQYFSPLQHPFSLKSAYFEFHGAEPGITTITNSFQGI